MGDSRRSDYGALLVTLPCSRVLFELFFWAFSLRWHRLFTLIHCSTGFTMGGRFKLCTGGLAGREKKTLEDISQFSSHARQLRKSPLGSITRSSQSDRVDLPKTTRYQLLPVFTFHYPQKTPFWINNKTRFDSREQPHTSD